MKASDLTEFLSKHPDCEILLATDQEGNSFKLLDEPCIMYVEKTRDGDLEAWDVLEEEDLSGQVDGIDEDPLDYFKPVVVLWP